MAGGLGVRVSVWARSGCAWWKFKCECWGTARGGRPTFFFGAFLAAFFFGAAFFFLGAAFFFGAFFFGACECAAWGREAEWARAFEVCNRRLNLARCRRAAAAARARPNARGAECWEEAYLLLDDLLLRLGRRLLLGGAELERLLVLDELARADRRLEGGAEKVLLEDHGRVGRLNELMAGVRRVCG